MFKYQTVQKILSSLLGCVVLCSVFSTQFVYGQTYQQNYQQQNTYPQAYPSDAYSHNPQQQQQKPATFGARVKSFLGIGEQPGHNTPHNQQQSQQHNQQGHASNQAHNPHGGVQHNPQHNSQSAAQNQHTQQYQYADGGYSSPNYPQQQHTGNAHNAANVYHNPPAQPGTYAATPPSAAVQRRPQTTQPAQSAQNARAPGMSRDTTFSVNGANPSVAMNPAQRPSNAAASQDASVDRLNRMRDSIFESTAKEREVMLERKESRLTASNSFSDSFSAPSRPVGSSKVGTSSTRKSATTTIDDVVDSIPDEPLAAKSSTSKSSDSKNAARKADSKAAPPRSGIVTRPSNRKVPKIALPVISAPPVVEENWDESDDIDETQTSEQFAEHEISTDDEIEAQAELPKLETNREKEVPAARRTVSTPPQKRVAAPTELSRTKDPLVASRGKTPELLKTAEPEEDATEKRPLPLKSNDSPKMLNAPEELASNELVPPNIPLTPSRENNLESRPKILSKNELNFPPEQPLPQRESQQDPQYRPNAVTNKTSQDVYPPDFSHKEKNLDENSSQQKEENLVSSVALIEVEMTGPKKRVVGQESLYQFKIVNKGGVAAEQVVLSIEMPIWAEVQSVDAKIGNTFFADINEKDDTHVLHWNIDRLEAGEKDAQLLAIHLVPRQRKTLTMSWDYNFKQPVGQSVIDVLEPKIEMSIEGPYEMHWGTEEDFRLRIQNTGNGDAEDLHLMLSTSDALPSEVETHLMGTLEAGQEKIFTITTPAKGQEKFELKMQVNGPFGLQAQASREVKVLRSKLATFVDAPEMQFVGNQNEYRITVQNTGTATAQNVEIKAWIPPGAKYISNEGNGRVLPGLQNQLIWKVDAIPVGEEFVCSLLCEMRKDGVCKVDVTATEKSGLSAVASASTQVDSIADLVLRINNPQGPVEVGRISTHSIVVTNRGSKAAENVEIVAAFAEGVSPLETEGAKAKIDNQPIGEHGGMVYFDTIPSIGPRQTLTLKIKAKSSIAGKQKIRVEMVCPDSDIHLVHEETTHYYSKQKGNSVKGNSVKGSAVKKEEPLQSVSTGSRTATSPLMPRDRTAATENRDVEKQPSRPIPSLSEILEKKNQALASRKQPPQTQTLSQPAPAPAPVPVLELEELPELSDLELEPLEFELEPSVELSLENEDSELELFPIEE